MRRRDFLMSIGIGALGAGLAIGRRRRRKPNIIYIMADDLGYGDLGCYGQERIKTPNIDRLAAEGMRFTDHYAGSTVCAPSRCCLMTGLHTGHARIRANGGIPLEDSDVTVAELMKRAGYATGIVGKWGCGEAGSSGVPNRQGFDYWFGYLNQVHAHNYYPEFLWRNDEKVILNNEVVHKRQGSLGGVATKRVQYSHDLMAQEALKFVERHRDEPFFLYLPFTIPHANNEAGQKGMEVPDLGIYKDKDWPEPEKGKAAMITRLDGDVGRLMARLDELGIAADTVVMFTSDNGPHKEGGADPRFFNSSGPLRGYKRALYEGGIRVPLIVRWKGRIKAGSESGHVSAFWDLLPTCCELADVKAPDRIDGISYAPTLLGEKQKQHEYLYWEFFEQGIKQAVRMGKWKAVKLDIRKNPDAPLELYDLSKDIGEQNNVAADHPDTVAAITKTMRQARTQSQHWKMPWE